MNWRGSPLLVGVLTLASSCALLFPLDPIDESPTDRANNGGKGGTAGSGGRAQAGVGGDGAGPAGTGAGAAGLGGSGGDLGSAGAGGETGPVRPKLETTLDTAGSNVCALAGGSVRCWGSTFTGALGDGVTHTNEGQATPVTVTNIDDAVEVEIGAGFGCARRETGTVACWGKGEDGQLGHGVFTAYLLNPVAVADVENVIDLAVGGQHACALIAGGGQVKCWGAGGLDQLGDGVDYSTSPYGSAAAVDVVDVAGATRIAAGFAKTCAILADRSVTCWGTFGDPLQISRTAAPVEGLEDIVQVAVGFSHACALDSTGAVWCWGGGSAGQLGHGDTADRTVPVVVDMIDRAHWISAHFDHTCVQHADNSAKCWGSAGFGELGDGNAYEDPNYKPQPVTVEGPVAGPEITAGSRTTCARAIAGLVYCWGDGSYGVLGNLDLMESAVPVTIAGVKP